MIWFVSIASAIISLGWMDVAWYGAFSIGLFFYMILKFVRDLGKKIVILDIIILLSIAQWLISATITYQIFNRHNKLASLWETFMTLSSDEYFAFTLPGTLALILGLRFPLNWSKQPSHQMLVSRAKKHLGEHKYLGPVLSFAGMAVFFFVPLLPVEIRAIFTFFSQLLYVGLFYVLFSPRSTYKTFMLIIVLGTTILNSMMTGMYGELLFWGMLYVIMFFMEYRPSYIQKILIIIGGFTLILLLQSIKNEYREKTWVSEEGREADFSYFATLIFDRLSTPSSMVQTERIFDVVNRANQGFLIAQTLQYVPKYEPFCHGETIYKAIAGAIVPRILWPDKPMTGGKEMVRRFLGAPDVFYSFNLSPLGEAYVNFGKLGGIIFMFFYGLIFKGAFTYTLSLSDRYPSIIAWLPLLFVGSLNVETDFLTTFGSLVKAAMFTWFTFWGCWILFRVKI